MTHRKRHNFLLKLLVFALFFSMAGCSSGWSLPWTSSNPGIPGADTLVAAQLPALPETLINFVVTVPADTPEEEAVYLSVLDEVTGLALNARLYPMQLVPPAGPDQTNRVYVLSQPAAIGSVLKYRYERRSGSIRVAEHVSDGSPVRYRMYRVDGPGMVSDVVSRWTDTNFASPTGRIIGQAIDASTGLPIPNLLVTAGGAQTITSVDGIFRVDGLPPGTHNLVAYSLDGSYRVFQQGALVAAGSTTPATLKLEPSTFVKVVFVVSLPSETPPVVPLRLAGNLYQLGNTFATLVGGVSSLATSMPVLTALPDGRYTLTLSLPVGADIRYKYTLGDGFWNAEHTSNGEFLLRQMVVPDHNVLIEEKVETWYASESPQSITFDVQAPAGTPAEDFVSIQLSPIFGWTEPIPMWSLGSNRWAYILYGPLNLPGNFSYRYCRDSQCGMADDVQTPGLYGAGRLLKIGSESQTVKDQVTGWANLSASPALAPEASVQGRGAGFWAGVELQAAYHPSWKARLPSALDNIQKLGANWLVLSPTWSYGRNAPGNNPPLLAPTPGSDMLWYDLVDAIQQAEQRDLRSALQPTPQFLIEPKEWWQSAPRDAAWWAVWFDEYRAFVMHHADLANRTGASALILGGDWIAPALPGGVLADGSPSGVPADAEARWRNILTEVRGRYAGTLAWALPYQAASDPPKFLDAVDQVYLLWSLSPEDQAQSGDLQAHVTSWLDNTVRTLQILLDKPLILAVSIPSDPDLSAQVNAYNILLQSANQRSWIAGFVARGFYPPVALQDKSASIYGKPASELLSYWYPRLLK